MNNNRETNRKVGSVKIAEITDIPIAEIHRLQYLLAEKGEITTSDNDGQSMIYLQDAGISAYVDRRYIKEGRKQMLEGFYDWTKILIPLAALVLSIYSIWTNDTLSKKINKLESEITKLKK